MNAPPIRPTKALLVRGSGALLLTGALVGGLLTSAASTPAQAQPPVAAKPAVAVPTAAKAVKPAKFDRPRTVVTTDMEQDDLASLVRYMYYTNDLDTQGIIYTSSEWHWAGDGLGTVATGQHEGPRTSLRWVGSNVVEDRVIPAYAEIYPNLVKADPAYPSPASLLKKVKLGNTDFEGEMDHDTAGSNLIKKLLLDDNDEPLYLQVWGGPNTVARALKSIEDQYSSTSKWKKIQKKVDAKAVILASGLQDKTYQDYISVRWPKVRVEQLAAGYATWGYNCDNGSGNTRGLPGDEKYFRGPWIKQNIQIGPLGSLYRSWLDGQNMPGDPADVFGDPEKAVGNWCEPLGVNDFLSEGDNVAYMSLLHTGIEVPSDPNLGSWGGRAVQKSASPDYWEMVPTELDESGSAVSNYTTSRWEAAAWEDFANRIQWGEATSDRNHAPVARIDKSSQPKKVRAGQSVKLRGLVGDPDGDAVTVRWWQYREEGTYPGAVTVASPGSARTRVRIPADARRGQTLSFILQVTDDGTFPLTRYARVMLQVR